MENSEREEVQFKKGENGEKPDVKASLIKRGFKVVGGTDVRQQLRDSERGILATYVPGKDLTSVSLSKEYGSREPKAYREVAEALREEHSDYVVR